MCPIALPLLCQPDGQPLGRLNFWRLTCSPLTPDGYFLVSASKDGAPMLRNGETGDWIGTFQGHKVMPVNSIVNGSPSDRSLVGADHMLHLGRCSWRAIPVKGSQAAVSSASRQQCSPTWPTIAERVPKRRQARDGLSVCGCLATSACSSESMAPPRLRSHLFLCNDGTAGGGGRAGPRLALQVLVTEPAPICSKVFCRARCGPVC